MRLPQAQVAVLRAADAQEDRPIERIAEETGLKPETATGAAFGLDEAGLLVVTEQHEEQLELTDEGRSYAENGLPERRLYDAANASDGDDGVSMGAVIGASGLSGEQVDIALANFARKGYGEIDSGQVYLNADADLRDDPEANALAALAAGETPKEGIDRLEERGLLIRRERTQ